PQLHISLPAPGGLASTMPAACSQVIVFPPPAVGEIVLTGPSTLDGEIAARYLARCRAEVVRRPLDDLFDGVEPLTIVAMDEEPRIEALIARLEGGLDYALTRNTF